MGASVEGLQRLRAGRPNKRKARRSVKSLLTQITRAWAPRSRETLYRFPPPVFQTVTNTYRKGGQCAGQINRLRRLCTAPSFLSSQPAFASKKRYKKKKTDVAGTASE